LATSARVNRSAPDSLIKIVTDTTSHNRDGSYNVHGIAEWYLLVTNLQTEGFQENHICFILGTTLYNECNLKRNIIGKKKNGHVLHTTAMTRIVSSFEMNDNVLTSGRTFCRHQSERVTSVDDALLDLVQHGVFSLVLQMPFFKHLVNIRTSLLINVANT